MSDIDIDLRKSSAGAWSVRICTTSLDGDNLQDLQRALRHCQKIADPNYVPVTGFENRGAMLVPGEDFKFKQEPAILRTANPVPNSVEMSFVRPDGGGGLSDIVDAIKTEIVTSPKSGRGGITGAGSAIDTMAGEIVKPKTKGKPKSTNKPKPGPKPGPKPEPQSEPKPKDRGGNADSLNMLNQAVAARGAQKNKSKNKAAEPPAGRDNRKPLKYNSTVREYWPNNPHGLKFTALTHPLPDLQNKLMTALRDLAAPKDGFGVVAMTDAELADRSGLGVSSICGTLKGLEVKDLIEREGGSGSKIWVY